MANTYKSIADAAVPCNFPGNAMINPKFSNNLIPAGLKERKKLIFTIELVLNLETFA